MTARPVRSHRSRRARPTRHVVAGSLAVAMLVALSACGADGEDTAKLVVPNVFDLEADAAKNIAEVDPARGAVITAEQLRNQLDLQLAWHGLTLIEVMRAARTDRDDMQVWIDQLTENTSDITATVGVAYGPVGARAFNQQWAQHTQFLVDYAVAVGQDDDNAAAQAKEALAVYAHDSGSFFSTATAGGLNAALVETMLNTHVGHMLSLIDAEESGDLAATLSNAVADSAYLGTISAGLAGAIAAQSPAAFPGSSDTPLAAFCSIITSGTSAYLSSLIITGDASSSAVLNADQAIANASGATTAAVIGLDQGFGGGDSTSRAKESRAALAAANAFALAHPPAVNAPVAGGTFDAGGAPVSSDPVTVPVDPAALPVDPAALPVDPTTIPAPIADTPPLP